MATLVNCVVDTGGTGDYTSLSTAEAANFGASSADITAAGSDEYIEVTCKCTDGQADSNVVSIAGQTTDATHTITIDVDPAYRYQPASIPQSGDYYRLLKIGNTTAYLLYISTSYVTIKHLPIYSEFSGIYGAAVQVVGDNVIIDGAKIRAELPGGNANAAIYITQDAITVTIKATSMYTTTANTGIRLSAAATVKAYMCTAVNALYRGFFRQSGTFIAKNCVAFGCGSRGFEGTFDASSTNNASDYNDAPGSNPVDLSSYSAEEIFEDPANDDYRLKQPRLHADDSPLYRAGADLSGDGVTEDIDGDQIIAWDIGCDHRPSRLVTVDPGGTGEYTSLSAAEAAYFGGSGADLTAAEERRTCECICTNGSADNPITVDGLTADSTFHATIRVAAGYRYNSTSFPAGGNYYRLQGTAPLVVADEYTRVEHLPVKRTTTSTGAVAIYAQANNCTFLGCKAYGANFTQGVGFYIQTDIDGTKLFSCFAEGSSSIATGFGNSSASTTGAASVFSCTAVNANRGFKRDGGLIFTVKNCVAFNCSVVGFSGTFDANSTNNASDDASAPGSNSIDLSSYSASDLFRDPVNGDYRLKVPDGLASDDHPLYRAGVNLYSDGVTDDIDGTGRSADVNFDVGCDQVGTVTRSPVIDIGGTGDYTSLSSAEAANFGAKGADLVAYDEKIEATWICTNGQAETTTVTIDGQTTSSTNFITITVPKRYRMPRVWINGNYPRIESGTASRGIEIHVSNINIIGAAVKLGASNSWPYYVNGDIHSVVLKSCIAYRTSNNGAGCFATYTGSGTVNASFISCLGVSDTAISYAFRFSSGSIACKALGCTAVTDTVGFSCINENTETVFKNCLFANGTTGFQNAGSEPHTHNASTAGDAPGSNAIDLSGKTLNHIFHEPNRGDYRPGFGGPINERGTDLRGEGVAEDLLGNSRPAKPAIGALEPPPPHGPIFQKLRGRYVQIA